MLIGIGLILFGIIVLIWNISKANKPKVVQHKNQPNYYIGYHELKLRNDKYYEEYLDWCHKINEIPMDKHTFIKGVEDKEKEIRNLYK